MQTDPNTFIAGLVDDLAPVTPLRQRRGMGWAIAAMAVGAIGLIVQPCMASENITSRKVVLK